jgi:hypothetical protein
MLTNTYYYESKARNEKKKKKKKKKKTQSATLEYFIVFDNKKHFGSRICNKFRISTVGKDADGDGSQLKKPYLYEEEKIQRKIETKQRRPYGGWVVGVVCGGGGDSAWLVGVARGMEAGDGRTGGGGSWWSTVLSWWVAVGGVEGGRSWRKEGEAESFWGQKKNFGEKLK